MSKRIGIGYSFKEKTLEIEYKELKEKMKILQDKAKKEEAKKNKAKKEEAKKKDK